LPVIVGRLTSLANDVQIKIINASEEEIEYALTLQS
jgi:hypothetical protein